MGCVSARIGLVQSSPASWSSEHTHGTCESLVSCLRALPELHLDVTGTCLLLDSLDGRRNLPPEV